MEELASGVEEACELRMLMYVVEVCELKTLMCMVGGGGCVCVEEASWCVWWEVGRRVC